MNDIKKFTLGLPVILALLAPLYFWGGNILKILHQFFEIPFTMDDLLIIAIFLSAISCKLIFNWVDQEKEQGANGVGDK